MNSIKEFYDQHPFPGAYTLQQLQGYRHWHNPYISRIDANVSDNQRVLDVGCGTGLITNLMAMNHRSQFVAVDFSSAVLMGQTFARSHDITNVTWHQEDFLQFDADGRFDVIIAQSFLNHVPAHDQAIAKIKSLLAPGGIVIVGVYNALGKFVQRCFAHDYRSDRLRLDQEHSPFEVTFAHGQVLQQWQPLCLRSVYPGWRNKFVTLHNLFNGRNGGLTLYVFEQQHD